ncbi:MAG: hypothetical protein PSN34_04010 [Urechidicola sp.]|nr:hypothetical protein [Urechidicola sp.]
MTEIYKKSEAERYFKFTQELKKLSEKYGVFIHSTGGVCIATQGCEKLIVEYDNDHTSGDLRNTVMTNKGVKK